MSARPEFYSGRGATLSDLDSQKLEVIYKAIVANVGEEAGKGFVQMVADIPKLSATAFLHALEGLERARFVYTRPAFPPKGIAFQDVAGAFHTVAVALSHERKEDDTVAIRRDFLRTFKVKEPRADEDSYYGSV